MYVVRREEKYLGRRGSWVALKHATVFDTETEAEDEAIACGEVFFVVVPYVAPEPEPYVPPVGAPRRQVVAPPTVQRDYNSDGCPRCGGPMDMKHAYFGAFWGCVKEGCGGFRTAKGTYMRVGQLAEKEIAGIPLLEVVRQQAGAYLSKDGKLLLRIVKPHKRRFNPIYWEAIDRQSGEVVTTESSCVRLRMALADVEEK